jgi:stage V sporulation protein AA
MVKKEKRDIFLKVKRLVAASPGESLLLEDLAEVTAAEEIQIKLEKIEVKTVVKPAGDSMIITALEIIQAIKDEFPAAEIKHLGEADVVVDIKQEEATTGLIDNDNPPQVLIFLIGIILFLGSGMAIMNFHADVSMSKVHHQIYELIMGESTSSPLLLQVPYSIGLVLGMTIFFNGIFGIKLDNDPSPLEIEMYLYEDKANRYSLHQKTQQAKEDNK